MALLAAVAVIAAYLSGAAAVVFLRDACLLRGLVFALLALTALFYAVGLVALIMMGL